MKHKGDNFKVQERWYEKLNKWDTALYSYEQRLKDDPHDVELILGQMRCLEALGEWYVEIYRYYICIYCKLYIIVIRFQLVYDLQVLPIDSDSQLS